MKKSKKDDKQTEYQSSYRGRLKKRGLRRAEVIVPLKSTAEEIKNLLKPLHEHKA